MSKQFIEVGSAKGEYGNECNRTACSNSPAIYYNHSTRMHYCKSCAELINTHNKADAMRMYGHDLCTLVSPATPLPQTEVGEALKAIDQELLWHQVVNFFQGEYVNNPHTTKEEIIRDLMQHYTITKKQ